MQIARLSLFDVNKKRLLFRAFPFRFRQSGESLRNRVAFCKGPLQQASRFTAFKRNFLNEWYA
jgi:hypothetical protein